MLIELEIRDFALIDNARVEFAPGLVVLTGETGVGKSLLLSALTFVLGEKASAAYLRAGAAETEVSALFRLPSSELARAVEAAAGLAPGEDGELLLRRVFTSSGANRCHLNGRPATVGMLKAVGELLLDIHGQHDHQSLLSPAPQLAVLDRFAEADEAREEFAARWREREARRRARAELSAGDATRRERLELLRAQAEEIATAAPQSGELETLEREKRLLAGGEKLAAAVRSAYATLYEAEGAAVERLHGAQVDLERAAGMDPELGGAAAALAEAAATAREVAGKLERYVEGMRFDPRRREEVEDRLHLLRRLLARYGPTVEAALAQREALERECAELAGADERLGRIDAEIRGLDEELRTLGARLGERRRKAAAVLERGVTRGLKDLAMPEAEFRVEFAPSGTADPAAARAGGAGGAAAPEGSSSGLERVEFCIAPNPGEPLKPLRRIASGGELARTMLAIKKVLAASDRIPVLVFDEIDANVGGRLGSVLARELAGIAGTHQVLCVTHMPQIAAAAHRHLRVAKASTDGRTVTSFEPLTGRARVLEIGEMIEGRPPSPTSVREAELLLRTLGAPAPGAAGAAKTAPSKVKPVARPAGARRRGSGVRDQGPG
ncbi:MAG: DNA repair protein RecN [Planctomycetes bacterium]|nr:DNA repair protein RecN [Planctomycetota bacterium]